MVLVPIAQHKLTRVPQAFPSAALFANLPALIGAALPALLSL
ncbi:hypothetical protein L682_22725 [Aquipseudomonas alcaligenes OT 69]|nr:hypothetical protein L682_22725 [Pseudomonas alcaligenes OT 69]